MRSSNEDVQLTVITKRASRHFERRERRKAVDRKRLEIAALEVTGLQAPSKSAIVNRERSGGLAKLS